MVATCVAVCKEPVLRDREVAEMVLSVHVSSKDGCCVVVGGEEIEEVQIQNPLQFSFSSVHDPPPTSREEQQYAAVAKLCRHTLPT